MTTIADIRALLTSALNAKANEYGENTSLDQGQLDEVRAAIDQVNETVNPNLPPRPKDN